MGNQPERRLVPIGHRYCPIGGEFDFEYTIAKFTAQLSLSRNSFYDDNGHTSPHDIYKVKKGLQCASHVHFITRIERFLGVLPRAPPPPHHPRHDYKNLFIMNKRGKHRLNTELDFQSLFGLLCTAVLIGWDPATHPLPPHLGSYTRALLVSQNRQYLFITPGRKEGLGGANTHLICTWSELDKYYWNLLFFTYTILFANIEYWTCFIGLSTRVWGFLKADVAC